MSVSNDSMMMTITGPARKDEVVFRKARRGFEVERVYMYTKYTVEYLYKHMGGIVSFCFL